VIRCAGQGKGRGWDNLPLVDLWNYIVNGGHPERRSTRGDELAWAHVKARVAKATTITRAEMKANVLRTMRRLQKLPHLVASFFQTPTCRYAAL
jgi:hypothetical protein